MASRLFPPEEKKKPSVVASAVRLPQELWDSLDRIAEAEGKSRNKVIRKLLELGVRDHDPQAEKKQRK